MHVRAPVLLLAGLLAAAARAQLGLDAPALRAQYGLPRAEREESPGVQIGVFAAFGCEVEVGCVNGVARRVVCRRPGLDASQVDAWLKRNREERDWSAVHPGADPAAREQNWTRPDNTAMAVWRGDELAITHVEWNQRAAPAAVAAAPTTGTVMAATAPPEPPFAALEGRWQGLAAGGATIVLTCAADGTATWEGGDETDRRQRSVRCARDGGAAPFWQVWTVPAAAPIPAVLVGVLRRDGDEALRFSPRVSAPEALAELADMGAGRAPLLLFRGSQHGPARRTELPDNAPQAGEDRESVIGRMGVPRGRMVIGDREMLLYNWGLVELAQRRVVRVQ